MRIDIYLVAAVAVAIMFGTPHAATAATIDFTGGSGGSVTTSPITTGDDEGLVVIGLVGLEGRLDPDGPSLPTFDWTVQVHPGSTPPIFVGLFDQLQISIFAEPDLIPQSTKLVDVSESGGLFSASAQTQLFDTAGGTGFQLQLNFVSLVFGSVGIFPDSIFEVSVTSNLPPLYSGGGDGDIAPIPLPAGVLMLLAGVGGFALVRHRQQRVTA